MAEFPALPLWTDAYLGDTMHLDAVEHGAYLLLLISAWRTTDTSLPDDDVRLARYARCTVKQWAKVRPVLAPFFEIADGRWVQQRLVDEKSYVTERREKLANNGSKGGRASALKRKERGGARPVANGKQGQQQTPSKIQPPTPSSTSPNGEGADAPVDVQKDAYDRGKALLIRTGTTPKAAGALITKWIRARDAQWVLDAVIAADDKAEPISWIEARMKAKASVEDEYRANAAATAARYRAADMGEPPEHVKRELGWVE